MCSGLGRGGRDPSAMGPALRGSPPWTLWARPLCPPALWTLVSNCTWMAPGTPHENMCAVWHPSRGCLDVNFIHKIMSCLSSGELLPWPHPGRTTRLSGFLPLNSFISKSEVLGFFVQTVLYLDQRHPTECNSSPYTNVGFLVVTWKHPKETDDSNLIMLFNPKYYYFSI